MTKTTDTAALDQWYAVETIADLGTSAVRTRLLGQDIELLPRRPWRAENYRSAG